MKSTACTNETSILAASDSRILQSFYLKAVSLGNRPGESVHHACRRIWGLFATSGCAAGDYATGTRFAQAVASNGRRYDSVLIFRTSPLWLLGECRSFEGTVAKCGEHLKSCCFYSESVACWLFAQQLGPPGCTACNADRFATIGFWPWLMRQSEGVRAGLFCPLNKKIQKVLRSLNYCNEYITGREGKRDWYEERRGWLGWLVVHKWFHSNKCETPSSCQADVLC